MKEIYCKHCHHSEDEHLNRGQGEKYLPCRGEVAIVGKDGEKHWPENKSYTCGCTNFEPGKEIEWQKPHE